MEVENRANQQPKAASGGTPGKLGTSTAFAGKLTTPRPLSATARPQTCGKMESVPFSPLSTMSTASSCGSASREAARQAKEQNTIDRIQKVQMLKEKWAAEKHRKSQFHKEKRVGDLRRLADDNAAAAEGRRRALEKQREIAQREKSAKQEQLSSSLQARAQLAADLEKEAKAKRRISMFLNNKMRKLAAEREAQLNGQKKEQEVELLASRRIDFLQMRAAKLEEDNRRRESMHNRTIASSVQREREASAERERQEEENSLLQMRAMNWQDDQQARSESEKLRRESMALRGNMWKQSKEKEQQLQQQVANLHLEDLQLKADGWKDVQQFKIQEQQNRRESLAGRLEKWREEKKQAVQQNTDDKLAAELERELETQARSDVQAYQKSIEDMRRQSLAYRLAKARKDKDFDLGQKALQQMVNDELRQLEALDRQDVQQYKERILESRRQSMQYRLLTERQERMRLEGERQAQMLSDAEDRELRALAWQDVQQYREEQHKQARHSLAWRLADDHRKKEIDIANHQEKLNKMHLDFLCKQEDWMAVQEHNSHQKEVRRKSIAMRLNSWRVQKMQDVKEKERDDLIKEEAAMLREMDREALMLESERQAQQNRKDLANSMVF